MQVSLTRGMWSLTVEAASDASHQLNAHCLWIMETRDNVTYCTHEARGTLGTCLNNNMRLPRPAPDMMYCQIIGVLLDPGAGAG